MKRTLLLLAFAAAVAAACAHQPRKPAPGDDLAREVKDMDKRVKELDKSMAEISRMCLGRAMHAEALLAPDAPEQAKREAAFKNYYESFLDAKGQGAYVDCLSRKYSVPWLHADYRSARRWLKTAKREEAENEPLAGPDKKIADVTEAFEKKDARTSLRRLTITLASGAKTTVEETFDSSPDHP